MMSYLVSFTIHGLFVFFFSQQISYCQNHKELETKFWISPKRKFDVQVASVSKIGFYALDLMSFVHTRHTPRLF
ncbi:hypothetical protein BY458DRAFT_506576 [Sporodiniella umbellata]|nr:hypothetical protein BY458DRAFT_506576 [Sporodiniella umbellata]